MINKLWNYGTKKPAQRIGVIILVVGLLSLFSWMIKEGVSPEDLFDSYRQPRSRDSFFFHLYFYLIPIGLLMSWGYSIILLIRNWIVSEKHSEDIFIKFTKRSELTDYVRQLGFGEKRGGRYMCGYVSRVLTLSESKAEAIKLGLINHDEDHVLHVDVLLITKYGEELVFAPCNSLIANLQVGDFVLIASFKTKILSEESWFYTLDAKLRPIYNKKDKGWVISEDYRV